MPPEPSATGPVIELHTERFVAGGDALARADDGKVVFAHGALPGEDVKVEITEDKSDWARGIVTEVVAASPERRQPPCAHRVEGCGGCDWQHLDDANQLPSKVSIVDEGLRRTGRLVDPHLVVGGSVPSFGYRTSVRVFGDADGRAGFRAERSHEVVAATGCLTAHPALAEAIDAIEIEPGLEVALRVSAATGRGTARWDKRDGTVNGLPAEFDDGPQASLTERVAGHDFHVSASSFFQSGPAAAELLVAAISNAAPELAEASSVIDLYAGVGLFAVASATPSAEVVAVETSRSAVADARVNLAGRAAIIEQAEVGQWRPSTRERGADVVIADPARSGLGRPGVATVAAVEAPVFVLVSCDPIALARDAQLLAQAGYEHRQSTVLDLFPQTHHVEVVTRFVRVAS